MSFPGPYNTSEEHLHPGGVARILLDRDIRGKVSKPFSNDAPPIDRPTEPFVWRLIRTAKRSGGVGLHAAQVGTFKDVFVMTLDHGETWHACVNPWWKPMDPEVVPAPGPEGCLSIPGESIEVLRHQAIRATWNLPTDTNPYKDQLVEVVLTGFAAVVFQHETDHGKGITILSKNRKVRRL